MTSKLLAILLLPLLTSCLSIGGAPVGEAAELVTMGTTRPLRDAMRPIRGGTRVLVIALDGVGDDDLRRAVREGRMPNVARLLGPSEGENQYAHGYASPDALSVLPSSTTPAWAATFTGVGPAQNGVPGNEWFVRGERTFHAPVPVTVRSRSHATRLYTDELMSEWLRAPTVYEGLDVRTHVSLQPFFRGADLLTIPNIATFGDLFEETAEGMAGGGSTKNPGIYRETDQSSVRSVEKAVETYGLPDLQVVYFPGIDLLTHMAEDPLESQQRFLAEVTDPEIGRVLELYRSAGALDRTFVLLVADHGHTPVLPDDRHSLFTGGDDEPTTAIERAGYRLRPHTIATDAEDFQAVVAYQGAMAFVYLADRATCAEAGARCDWARPPRLAADVLPLARAFHAASATGEGVPALRGTLDLVLARSGPGPFAIFDGRSLVPVGEYLRRNPRPDLVAFEARLEALAVGPHGDRAGDLLLLARTGPDRPIAERFYFAAPEHSDHGGAHLQDSRIPFLLAHPARSGAQLRAFVREAAGDVPTQTDVPRLIRALLAR